MEEMRVEYAAKHIFDKIELDYIRRRGWRVNDEGLLVLTTAQARTEPYMGRSLYDPKVRTLMIPGLHGSTLIFEGEHFIVTR